MLNHLRKPSLIYLGILPALACASSQRKAPLEGPGVRPSAKQEEQVSGIFGPIASSLDARSQEQIYQDAVQAKAMDISYAYATYRQESSAETGAKYEREDVLQLAASNLELLSQENLRTYLLSEDFKSLRQQIQAKQGHSPVKTDQSPSLALADKDALQAAGVSLVALGTIGVGNFLYQMNSIKTFKKETEAKVKKVYNPYEVVERRKDALRRNLIYYYMLKDTPIPGGIDGADDLGHRAEFLTLDGKVAKAIDLTLDFKHQVFYNIDAKGERSPRAFANAAELDALSQHVYGKDYRSLRDNLAPAADVIRRIAQNFEAFLETKDLNLKRVDSSYRAIFTDFFVDGYFRHPSEILHKQGNNLFGHFSAAEYRNFLEAIGINIERDYTQDADGWKIREEAKAEQARTVRAFAANKNNEFKLLEEAKLYAMDVEIRNIDLNKFVKSNWSQQKKLLSLQEAEAKWKRKEITSAEFYSYKNIRQFFPEDDLQVLQKKLNLDDTFKAKDPVRVPSSITEAKVAFEKALLSGVERQADVAKIGGLGGLLAVLGGMGLLVYQQDFNLSEGYDMTGEQAGPAAAELRAADRLMYRLARIEKELSPLLP